MSGQLPSGHLVLAAFAAVAAVALVAVAGCGSTISGSAQPAMDGGTVDAISTTGSPKTSGAKPSSGSRPTTGKSTPTSADRGGSVDFDANIGDCVTLGGTISDATIAKASCGSRSSNYKVIGKAPVNTQCVSDRDNYYAETLNGIEQGALCLDIDWIVGGCMDVGGEDPKRIDCTEHGTQAIKVTDIAQNADDADACDSGTGFTYPERHFVVCVKEL
ncbi:LppU family putative lipoprotein [Nocardia australiensis]|uniref:LppU family putative lipoprotein n=1 Tax=Nocardia australiensis TaxID=2887191 RepID=UPI001D1544A2|nr:hypothetical protein [Nocardia australiensis]